MLISFTVGNFLSFKDDVTLSLNATSANEFEGSNTFRTPFSNHNLLKSCVLYGANSSGKSNLLKALSFVKWFIINSSKELQAVEEIDVENFKLNTSSREKPSNFELVFIIDDIKYRYGFKVDRKKIHNEWLFYTKKLKEYPLFERNGQNIKIQPKFNIENKKIIELTRNNALFISVAAQFNNSVSIDILDKVKGIKFVSGINDKIHIDFTAELLKDKIYRKFIRTLLLETNLGFNEVNSEQVQITEEMINSSGMPEELRDFIMKSKPKDFLINTVHNVYNDNNEIVEKVNFNLNKHESLGTRKFFSLAGRIIHSLLEGKILLIDELEARLHPILCNAIIQLFNSNNNNPRNAQLIFATHNSAFLSSRLFRRDQIVLIEKDQYGASELETVYDRRIRKDASLEKDYLKGKYGAVPKINLPYQLKLFDND